MEQLEKEIEELLNKTKELSKNFFSYSINPKIDKLAKEYFAFKTIIPTTIEEKAMDIYEALSIYQDYFRITEKLVKEMTKYIQILE